MTAATLEPTFTTTPVPSNMEFRRAEILAAVDGLLKSFDDWQSDPRAPNVPTDGFEQALLFAAEVCDSGDTPGSCRELCVVTMPRLKHEWDEFENGQRRRDNTPMPKFWAAFDAVVNSRRGAEPFIVRMPPPVKELLDVQKVSGEQIAWYIWGENKQGPFVRTDGTVDYVKLRQEADKPGSVIGPDFIPDSEVRRRREWERATERRIVASNVKKVEKADYVDHTPVEEYLRQGQFPAVIATIKNITVDEVLKIAKKAGIAVPGPSATPATILVAKPAEPSSVMGDLLSGEQLSVSPVTVVPMPDITSEVRDRIVDLVSKNEGVPEIVAALKSDGVGVTAKQVQEIIKKAGG